MLLGLAKSTTLYAKNAKPIFENLRNMTKWSARFWVLILVVLVGVVVVVDDGVAAAGSADLPGSRHGFLSWRMIINDHQSTSRDSCTATRIPTVGWMIMKHIADIACFDPSTYGINGNLPSLTNK